MRSFTETLDQCRGALEAAKIYTVLDPTLVILPTADQLKVLREVISSVRNTIKQTGAKELSNEEIYEAHLVLALALLYRGLVTKRFNEAFDAATTATQLYPLRGRAYRIRGQVAFLRGLKNPRWTQRAVGDLDRALRYDAKDVVARYALALCHEIPALQRLEAASTLRDQGKQQRAFEEISDAEYALGKAKASWTSLLEGHPDHGLALLHRGVCLARLGELEHAEADLDRVCQLGKASLSWSHGSSDEKLAEAHVERARIASAQGRFLKALDNYRMAQEVNPDGFDALALKEKAEISLKACELDAVIEDCSKLLEDNDDLNVLLLRARAHLELEHFDLARADASRILSHDDRSVEARFLRGRCAAALGAIQSSLVDLDRCLEISPRNGEILAERAKVRLAAGSYSDAAHDACDVLDAIDVSADKGDVLLTLGCVQHHLGQMDEAKSSLLRAQEAGNIAALDKLRKWYSEDT